MLVDGTTGVFVELDRAPIALMAFTVVDDRVVEIDIINDPARLAALGAARRLSGVSATTKSSGSRVLVQAQ